MNVPINIPVNVPMILIGLVILISFCEVSSQACIKKARLTGTWGWLIMGTLLYSVIIYLLFMSYRYGGMGKVNLIWSCMSIVFAIVTGIVLFNETFNSCTATAIFFAAVAIFFASKS